MADDGEEKLIAAVRQIAKTLGDTMADDILQIFSNYDGRLSLDKIAGKHEPVSDPDTAPAPMPLPSIDRTLRTLDRQISRFASLHRPIWSDNSDAAAFLEAVDDLLETIRDLEVSRSSSASLPLLEHADGLLGRSMLLLENEFRSLIEHPDGAPPTHVNDVDEEDDDGDVQIPIARPVTDFDLVIVALPPGSIADLQKIAARFVAAGFGRECAEVFVLARGGFVDESIARLGIRSRTAKEIQSLPWPALEDEISRWIRAFQMVFRILLPSELRLCEHVFENLGPFDDLAFTLVSRAPALLLLSFADAVAAASRGPERLFRIVDMYEAVRDLLPEIGDLFSGIVSSALRADVAAVYKALSTSIKGIFMELENLIRRDPAREAFPGGGSHPITRYVMNYLKAACAFRQTLEEVMEGDSTVNPDRPTSSLAVHISYMMDVLLTNLISKSELYNDPSLGSVFLVNNARYILNKVEDSELKVLLGEEWIRRMASKIRQWISKYQRATWGKVVSALETTGGGGRMMGERLRMFNNYLEDICRSQARWAMADEQLRAAVLEMVMPAYRSVVGRLRETADSGRDMYVKYTPEDVEDMINQLFEGMTNR
ncbi:exocyst complex component EXO70B1-like [Typha latifolia]|uniref:exocyst complex component EXO70B1-like n=1 Tax=Typha latifolia TaxID=4733 RepID=UPI003C2FF28D